jgi:hypothetical protein
MVRRTAVEARVANPTDQLYQHGLTIYFDLKRYVERLELTD